MTRRTLGPEVKAMLKWTGMLLIAAAVAVPTFGAKKGNWYGYIKVDVVPTEGAPVAITKAGIQDSQSQSTGGKVLAPLSPETMSGQSRQYTVRYDLAFEAAAPGVVAVEVWWEGLNAFDELIGERRMAVGFKEPLEMGSTKRHDETADRLADDVSNYRVRITRVKFEDGTTWVAEGP